MQAAISATHMPMRVEHKTRDLGWQEQGTETAMVYTELLLLLVHSFYTAPQEGSVRSCHVILNE